MNGYKSGVLITTNTLIYRYLWDNPCLSFTTSPTSSVTQMALSTVFAATVQGVPLYRVAMQTYRERLSPSYRAVAAALQNASIPFYSGSIGGQFFWLDLR